MKLSARNVLRGRVIEIRQGATTAHVRLDIGGSTTITASTNVRFAGPRAGVALQPAPTEVAMKTRDEHAVAWIPG